MHSAAMELLIQEHEVILKALERLNTLLSSADLSTEKEELRQLIEFFRQYGDVYHHRKEEDILFSVLAEAHPMLGESLVAALEEHHEMFRETLTAAEAAIGAGEWSQVEQLLRQYRSDLRDHISAENDELFVAAEDILSEDEKERLYFSFLDKDRELGEARKQAYEERILGSL